MCWDIYYVHPQSGHTLFVDMLCQAAAGFGHLQQQNSAEKRVYTSRWIDWNIAESNGCLSVPANIHTRTSTSSTCFDTFLCFSVIALFIGCNCINFQSILNDMCWKFHWTPRERSPLGKQFSCYVQTAVVLRCTEQWFSANNCRHEAAGWVHLAPSPVP